MYENIMKSEIKNKELRVYKQLEDQDVVVEGEEYNRQVTVCWCSRRAAQEWKKDNLCA